MNDAVKNTDPPRARCGWCNGRLKWERGGYYVTCPRRGHPSVHDPRIHGLVWRMRILVGV